MKMLVKELGGKLIIQNQNKMTIELINVGRGNICKTVEVNGEKGMFRELKKCLMSESIELYPKGDSDTHYDVVVGGFRTVGELKIIN